MESELPCVIFGSSTGAAGAWPHEGQAESESENCNVQFAFEHKTSIVVAGQGGGEAVMFTFSANNYANPVAASKLPVQNPMIGNSGSGFCYTAIFLQPHEASIC